MVFSASLSAGARRCVPLHLARGRPVSGPTDAARLFLKIRAAKEEPPLRGDRRRWYPSTTRFSFFSTSAHRAESLQRPDGIIAPAASTPDDADSDGAKAEAEAGRARIPVGIFVDLDNVFDAMRTHGRADAEFFASPLRRFADRAGGDVTAFRAFGNESTRTFVTREERERREGLEQLFVPWDEHVEDWDMDGADRYAQTGYDKEGVLRCGVCGAKMKLSKKDRARGLTEEDKLDRHMRMLHDREQEKRKTRMRQGKGKKKKGHLRLSEKEMEKFRKYEAAQVGLFRTPASRVKKKKKGAGMMKTDLFQVLREQGIRCHAAHDVDSALGRAASRWMKRLPSRNDYFPTFDARGVLVVVSADGDFAPLLREARSNHGLLAVSVQPLRRTPTQALVEASDLVLTPRPEAETPGRPLAIDESGAGAGGDEGGRAGAGADAGALLSTSNTYEGSQLIFEMIENDGNDGLGLGSSSSVSMRGDDVSLSFEALPIPKTLTETSDSTNAEVDWDSDEGSGDLEGQKRPKSTSSLSSPNPNCFPDYGWPPPLNTKATEEEKAELAHKILKSPCRTDNLGDELFHRAYHCGLLKKKKGLLQTALVLHKATHPDSKLHQPKADHPDWNPLWSLTKKRLAKLPVPQLQEELVRNGIDPVKMTKKVMVRNISRLVHKGVADFNRERVREVLRERGVGTDIDGTLEEVKLRLVKSVLGVLEESERETIEPAEAVTNNFAEP